MVVDSGRASSTERCFASGLEITSSLSEDINLKPYHTSLGHPTRYHRCLPPNNLLTVGLAQMAPVWLNRSRTLEKVEAFVSDAARRGCQLVVFGEALVPGYPFWVELTDGARFNSPLQKEIFAEYATQAVEPEAGHLASLCALAAQHHIAVYLGCVERAADRGGHSLYCSLIYINPNGQIPSVHRKLQPTYEERLVWSPGDGHGLRTHKLGAFTAGGLNCW